MSNNTNTSIRSQSIKRKFTNSNSKLTSRKMNATTSFIPSDQTTQQIPYQNYDQQYQSQNPQQQQHQQSYETHPQPYHQQYGQNNQCNLPSIPPQNNQIGDQQNDRQGQQQFHHTTIYNIQNCYVQQPQHEMHQIFFPTDQYRHQSSQQQYESNGYKSAPPQNQFVQPPQPACWNPQPPVYNDRSSSLGLNQHGNGPQMPKYHHQDDMFSHPQLPGQWEHQHHQNNPHNNHHHEHSIEEFTFNNPFKFKHHDQLAPNFQQLTQVNKQLGESTFNPTHMLTRGYNCDQIVTRQLSHIPNKVPALKKRLLKRKIIRSKSQSSKMLPVVQDPHNHKLKIKRRRIGKRCRRDRCSKCRNCGCFDDNHDHKEPQDTVNFGTSAAMTLRKRKQKIVKMPFEITKEKVKEQAIQKVLTYPGINTIQQPAPGSSFELHELEQRIVEEYQKIKEQDVKIENELSFRRIGKLTLDERYHKIKRYQAKRDRRQWEKKISYDCRKQVADKRLRIKGRFIRKEDQNELMKQILGNDDQNQVAPGDMNKFNDSIKVIMKTMKQEQYKPATTNSQPKRKQSLK